MPVFNRPRSLVRALESIISQSYRDLEIVISDNCSPDPRIQEIVRTYKRKDSRIISYRQPQNIGPFKNYSFVLSRATGDFFMWAADDDFWEPFYVERLVDALTSRDDLVAANYEARYVTGADSKLDFFPEGRAFYSFKSGSACTRIRYMLRNNYGNLFYSLYRREVLVRFGPAIFVNEIPFFIRVAFHGNWLVLPEIGFFKTTNPRTYRQARWESMGGRTFPRILHPTDMKAVVTYHVEALSAIKEAINRLDLLPRAAQSLFSLAKRLLWKHVLRLAIGVNIPT
jgi:glycosyltransferase involved in cell wall biosynthesis